MIQTRRETPSVYYDKSRDFQLLGRVFDIVFNYIKTGQDTMENNPLTDNTDLSLHDLVALTLGFKANNKYNSEYLHSICSTFTECLRSKGTVASIEKAVNCLLRVEGITNECYVYTDADDPFHIFIFVSDKLTDLNIFNDLLSYIIPAGLSVSFIKQEVVRNDAQTFITSEHSRVRGRITYPEYYDKNDQCVSIIPTYEKATQPESGIDAESGIYAADYEGTHDTHNTYAGRMDNSVIITYKKEGD